METIPQLNHQRYGKIGFRINLTAISVVKYGTDIHSGSQLVCNFFIKYSNGVLHKKLKYLTDHGSI